MKKLFFTFVLLAYCPLHAQNLVPNPSFESYNELPCSWITSQEEFMDAIHNWIMPTGGSTDIFSMEVETDCYAHCFSTTKNRVGEQRPRTGKVMSAILTYGEGCTGSDYREYLEVELIEPLVVGETYYAEIYVSHTDQSREASNNIGMYFSEELVMEVNTCKVLSLSPQVNATTVMTDHTNWVRVSGTFVATTPAKFLIIGNFYDNASTDVVHYSKNTAINARYYVDDVLVKKVERLSHTNPLPSENGLGKL